jgi:cysteine desulfurase / selenocysteine lyase
MLNVAKIRKDFVMLDGKHKMQGKPLIYLDNAATTFKPKVVLQAITKYHNEITANPHRGDYDLSHKASDAYEGARKTMAKFMNCEPREVIFTSGASQSLNIVAYALGENLKKGDEILLTEAEHGSNVLPWYKVAEDKGLVIKFIPLTKEGKVTVKELKSVITKRTKVMSIAHVTNVLGHVLDIKALTKEAHKHGIIVAVDGAQSVPRIKTDVKDWDIDFLSYSGHKLCAPTGTGVLYGKYEMLDKLKPLMMGGGMNTRFDTCGDYMLQKPPLKFEAGTPNVEGVMGLEAAVKYMMNIGMDNIQAQEEMLMAYAVKRLKEVKDVVIYNETATAGVLTFNIKDIFAQDVATHLNSYGIAVRAGQHCAKILLDFLKAPATVRMSVAFYNTKEEIDKFIEATKKAGDYLDAYFK